MPNKVIFFVTNLDNGGLENYLLRFLESYAHKFEDIIVFCRGNDTIGVLEGRYNTIKKVRIVKRKIGNYHPHHYLWLKRWFNKHEGYVVCDFTGNFAGPVLWTAAKSNISKRIAFYRSSSNRFQEDKLRLLINKIYNSLVYKSASDIFANSKYAFDFFFPNIRLDERFKVIYNGLNVEQFMADQSDLREEFGIDDNTFVIGHTGRYNPAKNHRTILDVAYRLLATSKNVVFIMCGKGVKDHLYQEVEAMGLCKRILLFEDRTDISRFLNTCNAYIFPSLTEGQPNSLIEAWVKGLPFVASDIPPIKDLVQVAFYNYLKDPHDVEGITDALTSIIQGTFDKSQRDSLRNWANVTFDSQERFEELYQELIK